MYPITKQRVLSILQDGQPRRKQFSKHSGIQRQKDRPTFSIAFDNGLLSLLQEEVGLRLTWNERYRQFYAFLPTHQEITTVETWEEQQGTRVFIRNCLSSCVALDENFANIETGVKTAIGEAEEAAKYYQNREAIEFLCRQMSDLVGNFPLYRRVGHVCAVPASPTKEFNLPRTLATEVSAATGLTDVTPFLRITEKACDLKKCSVSEKWDVWADVEFDYNGPALHGESVLIVDDKYQSGITLQYVASQLQDLGAEEVHGLVAVKTIRDSDNMEVDAGIVEDVDA